MSEQPSEGSSAGPFLGALAIIVAVVIGILLFNVFSSDEPTPDQQIARAVSAQNDALQRRDYAGFLEYTCAAQHGKETEVLSAQRDSVDKHGERVVDRVAGVAIDGDRATAQVTYYFDKDPDAEETVDVELAREAGSWKVCSTGPR